jgi:hypothetical protein
MFNISSYQKDANQNYTEVPFYFSQNDHYLENKMSMKIREKGILIAGQNIS